MTAVLRSRLAQRVFNTPLLMHPRKAVAAVTAIGGRIVEGGIEFASGGLMTEPVEHIAGSGGPIAGRIGDRLGRAFDRLGRLPFDVVDNVAVIPIEGTLVHKGAYVGAYSGETSYQGIQTQVARARRSDQVRGVVFEVDSFGGEVAGAFETATMIRQLSDEKPTLAILTDFAYSAGYLLASAARQIVMPKLGGSGSIGVVVLHADFSQLLENKGVKVTLLHAGARKVDGNPFEPLPDEVAARMQTQLEEGRRYFAEFVGMQRGDRFTTDNALATEAEHYRGEESVTLGLADAIGNGNEAFDAFVRAVNRNPA